MSLLCTGCGTGVTVLAMVSPSISQVSPQVVTAGTPDVTVTVQGANFESQSSLTVNGAAMPTTFVNSTTLAAKISGTMLAQPAVAQLQVRNANGASSNQVSLTVSQAPGSPDDLAIRTTQLPSAQVGTAYSVTFSATGGSQPYTWSVSSGSLPSGLTLSSAGVLSGTPTASGTSTFTVKVVESGFFKQTKTATYSIVVSPASKSQSVTTLSIGSTTMGSAQVGASYAVSLSATGGTQGYTWSMASGSLPAGLALSSAGVISGTPTATGTSTFNVTVKDSGSPAQTASAQESITVTPATLSITSTSLAAGTKGSSYSATLGATGGTPSYTWSISSGSLPAGLSLSRSGVISGTPTTKGTTSFTVSVKDGGSPVQTSSAQESITVGAAAASTLTITSTSLGAAQTGSSYNTTLSATGGTASYAWSIASGSLPAGLSLSSAGVISGTPTASGTATFTVSVKDSGSPVQTASAQESIAVSAPALTVTSTNLAGGSKGSSYSTTLSASGGTPGYTWSIASGSLPAGLTLSSGGVISGTPTATGSSTFTVSVKDSGSPVQTASAQESITVAAASSPLTVTSTNLNAAQMGTSYSTTLNASGGTPNYSWSVSSGSLPAGLTLSSSGAISGTPTATGTSTFTVSVNDSSSPVQNATAQESITVSAVALAVTTSSLSSGTNGSSYSATLAASGGAPSYTWSISSGSLPAGLSLSSAGVISGTPSATGTATFTVSVNDSSSPVQNATAQESITINAAQAAGPGMTWYVRPDGGTRYSSNMTTGQCDGKGDAPYSGDGGTNEHCAFNDVRYLWQDGSYTDGSTFPAWGWVIAGGDTVIIRGSIADGVSYRIGWNNNSAALDSTGLYWGIAGDPYDSGMPMPPAGTASQHTRILGENYGSCHAAGAKTQLHGGFGVYAVINMQGANYVDLACLDITDFSSCGRANQTNGCSTSIGSLSDFATNGIIWSNTSTNDTLTDVHIHGLASTGMLGPTGGGEVFSYLDLIGNASSGWDADPGNGTTGTGTALIQNFNISWNGCAEEYPMVDPLPYQDCTDDGTGGYGDGFGTTTLPSKPGWQVSFDQGVVTYNTQDGLDALHLTGLGSSMTITRVLAYGNMGQQIKVGGAAGTAMNNVLITNCNAMRQAIPGTPSGYNSRLSDFCRAADTGIEMTVGKGSITRFDFNTVYSANATSIEIDCDTTAGQCDSTSLIDFRNNVWLGFPNATSSGYPANWPITNNYSNPIYMSVSPNPFTNAGSFYSNNLTYHYKSTWSCPAPGESSALCVDPQLTDESWYLYGYGQMTPQSGSVVQGAGIPIPSVLTDYTGAARGTPPAIGAYE